MEQINKPRLKAMCIFLRNGKTLASKGYDKDKDETFYRLIGGSVDFGEKSQDGIQREIQEELGCDVKGMILVKVVENIFTYEGNKGHDIVFLYKGELSNEKLYTQEKIHVVEPYGEFDAEWIPVADVLSKKIILYPALDYSDLLK